MKSYIRNAVENQDSNAQNIFVPNRKQKRDLAKKYHMSYEQINKMFAPKIKDIKWDFLPDDTVVKLNYERIKTQDKISQTYLNWVESHKDQELHVYRDEDHITTDLYCVREDTNPSPWLFHISDLEVINLAE